MVGEVPKAVPRAGTWWRQGPEAESFYAFIPAALPPDPPVRVEGSLQALYERAVRSVGRLDGIATLLPNPHHFLYVQVRREAVVSSQIEGTLSSLSDLLLFEIEEAPGVPLVDVREVSNYVAALEHGLRRLEGGFPLCVRLLREIHGRLMRGVRGGNKEPGEFRRSQNWIGGTRPGNALFVPPPAPEVAPAMAALEKYLHSEAPAVIKAGLAHAQFETIHPFLDGNGRLGRLLIAFVLCVEGALSEPLLYLSLYFKRNRTAYYAALQRVRTDGDWEGWLRFYLVGMEEVAREGANTIRKLVKMFDSHRESIQGLGRASGTALRLHDLLKKQVYVNLTKAAAALKVSFPTVSKAAGLLQGLDLLRERTGRRKNRIFVYEPYLKVLEAGTKGPPG